MVPSRFPWSVFLPSVGLKVALFYIFRNEANQADFRLLSLGTTSVILAVLVFSTLEYAKCILGAAPAVLQRIPPVLEGFQTAVVACLNGFQALAAAFCEFILSMIGLLWRFWRRLEDLF